MEWNARLLFLRKRSGQIARVVVCGGELWTKGIQAEFVLFQLIKILCVAKHCKTRRDIL